MRPDEAPVAVVACDYAPPATGATLMIRVVPGRLPVHWFVVCECPAPRTRAEYEARCALARLGGSWCGHALAVLRRGYAAQSPRWRAAGWAGALHDAGVAFTRLKSGDDFFTKLRTTR